MEKVQKHKQIESEEAGWKYIHKNRVPFTLNSKPTPGGREFSETSRAGEPARLESGVVPTPLSVPRHWDNNPVSTVYDMQSIAYEQNTIMHLKNKLTVKIGKFLKTHAEVLHEYIPKIMKVLVCHPNWTTKSKDTIGITILKTCGIRMFGLVKSDGTVEEISFRKAIYGEEYISQLRIAMANTIKHVKIAHLKLRKSLGRTTCDCCGNQPGTIITHNSPSYQYLVEGFLQTFDASFINTFVNARGRYQLIDRNLANAWIKYYKDTANFALSCPGCFDTYRFTVQ
jgi:hypothetical protein